MDEPKRKRGRPKKAIVEPKQVTARKLTVPEIHALVKQWDRYACKVGYNFSRTKAGKRIGTVDECIHVARIGMLEAARRFEPDRGFLFSTYSTWWMRRYLQEESRGRPIISLPSNVHGALEGFKGELEKCSDETISLAINSRGIMSLLAPGEEGTEIEWLPAKPEPEKLDEFIANTVRSVVASLPPRERLIIGYRFGFVTGRSLSLEQASRIMRVTKERVRQIEVRAMRALKERLLPFKDRLLDVG